MIDGSEILPRLWIGTCASCEAVRGQDFFCLNVLEGAHTADTACIHLRVLGDDGKAMPDRLAIAHDMINHAWGNPVYRGVLVHCGAGVERSPLVVAMWMLVRFNLTLDEAYKWIKQERPIAEDRRAWLRGQ